jgi:uncharacterized protein with HEPN domain
MEIDQLGRLRDILEAARLIGTYVKTTTESDFYADKQKQDAVIRRIEIIGEAAAHVSAAPAKPSQNSPSEKCVACAISLPMTTPTWS